MDIRGVIHAGAHFGQEMSVYKELGIETVDLFEPLPDIFKILTQNAAQYGYKCHNVALGDKRAISKMNREHSNLGMSSSILEPERHLINYPDIVFDSVEAINIETLDSFGFNGSHNMLYMDCQGYEGLVIKGANKTLKNIDYIYTELNFEPLYKNCILAPEMDNLLSFYDFTRVETGTVYLGWTDALYIKS